MLTYISLFSGAGVGCYGFQQEGFTCVATNELKPRRMEIQRYNHKCKYDSGYICGDIADASTKLCLSREIRRWYSWERMRRVDVIVATPPCQGMSVANRKKRPTEIVRNSLVVESIQIIRAVKPRFFVIENVPAFMKTICTDVDGVDKPISEAIHGGLSGQYRYMAKVINFKDYGAGSSRKRTLVIGAARDLPIAIDPSTLFPQPVPERTLREVIGHLRPLHEMGEIDENDIYHAFRPYPPHMRAWISDLKEGESAFDNKDPERRPHRVVDGGIKPYPQKCGGKYTRQRWEHVGPCIHTRTDQLSSQNTVHPADDRVFSIRELMLMMSVPDSFRWMDRDPASLNALPRAEKALLLKQAAPNIRQSLGEAVPAAIFRSIAANMKAAIQQCERTAAEQTA